MENAKFFANNGASVYQIPLEVSFLLHSFSTSLWLIGNWLRFSAFAKTVDGPVSAWKDEIGTCLENYIWFRVCSILVIVYVICTVALWN